MGSSRALLFLLLLSSLLLCMGVGCSRALPPELLKIDSLSQGVLESGSVFEIQGRGFVENGPVQIIFDGDFYASGRNVRSARVVLSATSQSISSIRHQLSDGDIRALLGGSNHATFRGKLAIEFPRKQSSAALLRGSAGNVVLDIASARALENDSEQQLRFVDYFGVDFAEDFVVTGVRPESPASSMGLSAGDQLLALDGVRLLYVSDFLPRSNATISELSWEGAGQVHRVHFPRQDFVSYDWVQVQNVLLALVLALGMLLALVRPPQFLRTLGRNLHRRRRFEWSYIVAFPLFFLIVWLAPRWMGPEFALPLLLGVCVSGLCLSALLLGGKRSGGRFSLLAGLGEARRQMVLLLPYLVAIGVALSEAGALSFDDLRGADSADGFYLLASPWALMLSLISFLVLVPERGRAAPGVLARSEQKSFAQLMGRLNIALLLLLWTAVFWGRPESATPLAWLLFLLKSQAVFLVHAECRYRLGYCTLRESASLARSNWLWLGVSLSFYLVLVELLGNPAFMYRQLTFAWGVAALLLAVVVYLRSLSHFGRQTDPWI